MQFADEASEAVAEGEMPPASYLFAHPEARLRAIERNRLVRGLDATVALVVAAVGWRRAEADHCVVAGGLVDSGAADLAAPIPDDLASEIAEAYRGLAADGETDVHVHGTAELLRRSPRGRDQSRDPALDEARR